MMTKYRVTGRIWYEHLVLNNDYKNVDITVEADSTKAAKNEVDKKIPALLDNYIESHLEDWGWTTGKPPVIEAIPEPSEAAKMERAGFTPLFPLDEAA